MAVQSILNGEIKEVAPTQTLANQGYVPIGNPLPLPDTSKLSADNLSVSQPINYKTPEPVPVYPVAGLNSDGSLAMTEQESKASDLSKRLQELNNTLTGKSTYQAEQEAKFGLPELQKTQTDLTAQLKAIQNEALAIPLQLQQEATGKGLTAGGLQPLQTARLRTNAIQALSVNSLLEASKGNIATALTMIDRAVAQKFDPIKEQIDAATKNLKLIIESPEYTLEDKNRAQTQLNYQNEKKAQVEAQAATAKSIMNTATEAAKNGATADVLKRISEAQTEAEALQLAAPYIAASFNIDREQQAFDNLMKSGQLTLQQQEFAQKIKQQAIENEQSISEFKLKREMFESERDFKKRQQDLEELKSKLSGGKDAPVVKEINGVSKQWNDQTGQWEDIAQTQDPQAAERSLSQIALVKDTLDKTEALSKHSGSNTKWEQLKQGVFGSTDYTRLVALTNTLRTNVLTMMTDPAIKKFFGPQMSNADVQLMTAAGTTLNPELQSPEDMKAEITRLKNFTIRAEAAVRKGNAGKSGYTKDGKTKADLQFEFPYATPEEIDKLFKEEGGFTKVEGDTNKALSYKEGSNGGQCGVFVNKTAGIRVGNTKSEKIANVNKYGNVGSDGIMAGDVIVQGIGDYGHVAVVTKVNPDGSVEVTESNYNENEKVTHGRVVNPNKIYGYLRPSKATALSINNKKYA